MSTAQSVKTQIQSLIDSANVTTGNNDATLTDAVGHLVEGYGQGGSKSAYQYAQDGGYTGTEAEFKEKMAGELKVIYDYEDLNEKVLATTIKPEVSGEFIHITDSAALPIMNFGMEGKTEQDGTPTPDTPQEIINAGTYNEATGRYEIGFEIRQNNILNPTNIIHNKYIHGGLWTAVDEPSHNILVFDVYEAGYYGIYANYVYQINNRICAGEKLNNTFSNRQWVVFNLSVGKHMISIKHNDSTPNTGDEEYMVVKVNSATASAPEYEEYVGQPLTLTSPVPITKWDKLVKRDGVYGWSIMSDEYSATGLDIAVTAYKNGSCTNRYVNISNNNVYTSPHDGVCEDLSLVGGIWSKQDIEGFALNSTNQFHICIRNSILGVSDDATIAEQTTAMVNYLKQRYESGNPIKVRYKASTEQSFHPLPESEQALLKSVETYYQVTNIFNDQNCPMSIQYIADTQTYIDNLANGLASAVVSLREV